MHRAWRRPNSLLERLENLNPFAPVCVFLVLLCCCLLLVTAAGCSCVTDGAMQSLTHHGSLKAVLPPSSEYELVSLRTKDGTKIVAQFGRARDRNGALLADYGLRPTVVYCYPGGGTMRWSAPQFEGFRRLGLNVIMPEYPGYGMSDGQASESGFYAAAEAAYDYVLGRTDLDHTRIFAAGWSLGGSAAVDLSSRRQTAGLVIVGTSTTFRDLRRYYAAGHPLISWLAGRVLARIASMVQLDSLAKIPSVRCPILLVSATQDQLVSKEMTDRLAAAARTKMTLLRVDGAGHYDIFRVGGAGLWRTIGDWIVTTDSTGPGTRTSL